MKKGTTTKKQDLIELFDRDVKVYGEESKEIKELIKEGIIKKAKDDKGTFYIKK